MFTLYYYNGLKQEDSVAMPSFDFTSNKPEEVPR